VVEIFAKNHKFCSKIEMLVKNWYLKKSYNFWLISAAKAILPYPNCDPEVGLKVTLVNQKFLGYK